MHDPLVFPFDGTDILIDLVAERLIAAERNDERLVAKMKSFLSKSAGQDLKVALSQFILCFHALAESTYDLDRVVGRSSYKVFSTSERKVNEGDDLRSCRRKRSFPCPGECLAFEMP